jgi:hypothetical protein
MSNRIYVGTRKGLFTLERNASGWEIGKIHFLGEPVTMLLQDPRDGWLYATLTLGHFGCKLHRSSDGGENWEECGVPACPPGSEVPIMDFEAEEGTPPKTKPASLSEIWSLETAGDDQPGTLWAGSIPAGLFRSTDRGSTWQLMQSLWDRPERLQMFGGGKDDSGLHSICVDPHDSRHVTIAISSGGVWETTDGGESWELIGHGLRADYMPPDMAHNPLNQDVHRLAQCPADPAWTWVQHHNGVFRSSDGGKSFQELDTPRPSVFGFAVCVHPRDGKTAWFVPAQKDQYRIPVDGRMVVSRTRDGGESFEVLDRGLPDKHCYDIVFRHGLDVDGTGERLAMGSSTGGLWISEDGGDSWTSLSNTLPQIYCVRFDSL